MSFRTEAPDPEDPTEPVALNWGRRRTPSGWEWKTDAVFVDDFGNVGVGTTFPGSKLSVTGTVSSTSGGFRFPDGTVQTTAASSTGADGHSLDASDGSPTDAVFVDGLGNVGIGTTAPASELDVRGLITSEALEIVGGADLAEPFAVEPEPEVAPGMVMSIDPDRPGALRLSARAYDRRVAGVISGAGGVKPGLKLGSVGESTAEQEPVALSGRVYVWADATQGPIRPGDLLTTADVPGHAMAVTDHARAMGAILGKAMSSLEEGRGLVLALVALQ